MTLPSIISDGMVLQRNDKVTLWGKAQSLEEVNVFFLENKYNTMADHTGKWSIMVENLKPGGPFQMEIHTKDEKTLVNDILIGDVWVLGGQSNMQLPVNRTLDLFEEEVKTINQPFIRQFTVPQTTNFQSPQHELNGGEWFSANPKDVLQFSAAGYFFAEEMYKQYEVPIGLILTAIGGTPIEAWISEKTLCSIGGYENALEKSKDDEFIEATMEIEQEQSNQWFADLNERDLGLKERWYADGYDTSNWKEFEIPNSWEGTELEKLRGAVWFQKTVDVPASMCGSEGKLSLGTIIDADDTYVNGKRIGNTGYMYPPRRYHLPKGILKPGKNIITVRVLSTQNTGGFVKDMPFKLKVNGEEVDLTGTWKYRIGAETDAMEPQTFFHYWPSGLFNGMISPIQHYKMNGVLWYQGESNTGYPKGYRNLFEAMVNDWRQLWNIGDFPFIYTQLANFGERDQSETNWAEVREEQRTCLNIPNTGMAVTIDIGEWNDIHPQDKKTVGKRLALVARKIAYGEDLVHSGPIYKSKVVKGKEIVLHFDQVGSGLIAKTEDLEQFQICGEDGNYLPAKAVISGDTVIVSNEEIMDPLHVRYAWANNPEGANLYNKEGLPASPFTTERL